MPWASSDFAASACLPGSHHEPVKTTYVLTFGLTDCAPSSNASMLSSVCGIGKAATKPSLPDLVAFPAAMPPR